MSLPDQDEIRRTVAQARTIVVKVGSSSLTTRTGHLDQGKLNALVGALASVRSEGARLVLVSSGAIAAGFGPLGFDVRPHDVSTQQATASVGQGLLMAQYESAFARWGLRVGQILITARDTTLAVQYRNAQRTLCRLLDLGVIPIVNENDALASNEIRLGDNDRLSALVANIVGADALVLLTDVDALYTAPPGRPGARRIEFVSDVTEVMEEVDAQGSSSGLGTGGMGTKLDATRMATSSGIPVVLASANQAGPALSGDRVGTLFAPIRKRGSSHRLWIKYASRPQGGYVVDPGAARAIRGGRASLLAAGTVQIRGGFSAGDPVWVWDQSGNRVAKGLSGYDSEEAEEMLGLTTKELRRRHGPHYAHPLIHRDSLVLL